jgi:hypothetical protein
MPLDLKKLENLRTNGQGKTTARCPACARNKHDRTGDHLVIYPDGRFGCVASPGDPKHRQEIWRLCGQGELRQPRSVPVRCPRKGTVGEPVVLRRFGRGKATANPPSETSGITPENVGG